MVLTVFIMGSIPVRVTKNKTTPNGVVLFLPYGNRKAVKKTCRGHVFRPWEIPFGYDGNPQDRRHNQTSLHIRKRTAA